MNLDSGNFENRLRNRPGLHPDGGFRDRVLSAIADELEASRQPRETKRSVNLYWPALAAAALVLMSLSMFWASADAFSISPSLKPDKINSELRAVQQFEAQQ